MSGPSRRTRSTGASSAAVAAAGLPWASTSCSLSLVHSPRWLVLLQARSVGGTVTRLTWLGLRLGLGLGLGLRLGLGLGLASEWELGVGEAVAHEGGVAGHESGG